MKNALLIYRDGETNIGDYIQSIAAKQFLKSVDIKVCREELNKVKQPIKLIMNGWFMHEPKNWPPSTSVIPKYVSFHIANHAIDSMLTKDAVAHFKKFEPIGCRDYYTQNILTKQGIKAYFTGCLTLTLKKEDYVTDGVSSGIIFSDILFHKNDNFNKKKIFKTIRNPHKIIIGFFKKKKLDFHNKQKTNLIIEKLIPKEIINNSKKISNQNFKLKTHQEKFDEAKRLLSIYASAELVVTSRIHVALPCLAFGTPVIFIKPERDVERFDGIIDLFHTFTIKEILESPKQKLQQKFIQFSKGNKKNHLPLIERLMKDVCTFAEQ